MAIPRHVSNVAVRLVTRSQFPYVCKNCQKRAQELGLLAKPQQRYVSNQNLPFTEKLRRKIWGTDNPPGLKDPYGGPSFLERRQMRAEERKRQEEQQAELEAAEKELDKEIANEETIQIKQMEDSMIDHAAEAPKELRTSNQQARIGLDDLKSSMAPNDFADDEPYEPAETWDGLRHIGHRGHWRDMPPRPEDEYTPWLRPSEKAAINRELLIAHLRLAIIECLAEDEEDLQGNSLSIVRNQNGYISHIERGPDMSESDDLSASYGDDDFLSARFDFSDPRTFIILSRFQKEIRIRLSDPFLNSLANPSSDHTLSYLIGHLTAEQQPKAKTTYEQLMKDETLTSQPNVVLLPRRETPVDKEKAVGRWKIIERELKNRGLPVLGRVNVNA